LLLLLLLLKKNRMNGVLVRVMPAAQSPRRSTTSRTESVTTRMRILRIAILAALALGGVAESDRADHVSSVLSPAVDGSAETSRPTGGDSIVRLELPLQLAAAPPVAVRTSVRGMGGAPGVDIRIPQAPSPGSAGPLASFSLHPLDPARIHPTPGVEYRGILQRSGAISAFATSLPPPPEA
jgi:hypothetical protein